MAEYIEREALMRRIKEIHCAECDSYHGVRCRACWVDDTLDYIDSEQAADVAPVQEWISVEDKLPPYNRDVLVYRPNMAMRILVDNYAWHYRDDDDEWYEDWTLCGKDTNGNPVITHWAYLPEPPKGE